VDRPKLSVVVPTYNRAGLLRETLRHLARQRMPADEFEVVVADDGSDDGTKDVVEAARSRLTVKYHYQEDRGFRAGTARNAGARLASAPVLVFLDTGAVAGPDYLHRHLAAHEDGVSRAVLGYAHGFNPDAAVPGLGPVLARMAPEDVLERFRDVPEFRDVRHDELASCDFDLSRKAVPWMLFFTINCSIRADEFWSLGGFDETFHGWGVEDLDFAFRLYRKGVPLHLSREAWVIESPHERDMDANMAQFRRNIGQFLRKFPEPVAEIGWVLVQKDRIFVWDESYHELLRWRDTVRKLDVAAEVDEALRVVPPGDRIAVFGAGGRVPETLPPAVLLDFDADLLRGALRTGRHTGNHAVGLRTPLADQSVDSVILTSRLAGLWDRWSRDLLTEAHRVGRRVFTFDHPTTPAAGE
jgi:glycosyltransferase involved in cell wall biosynthesis